MLEGAHSTAMAIDDGLSPILGALPDAVLVATAGGRIVATNANLCDLTGYSADELRGAPIEMLVPSSRRARHVALRSHYIEEGGGLHAMSDRPDIVVRRADGVEVPVDVALCTVTDSAEGLVVATLRDASRRRNAELAAERERRFLSALNDISAALFADGDLDDTLRLITHEARHALDADLAILVLPNAHDDSTLHVHVADGLAQRELVGSPLPEHESMAGFTMRSRQPVLIEDGSEDPRLFRPVGWPPGMGATLIAPLHARGDVVGSITVARLRDRPMFRASEVSFMTNFAEKATLVIALANAQQLAEREHELTIAARVSEDRLTLQGELIERLEEVDKTKSDFVSRVSHELRAPLASIMGYVELLVDIHSTQPDEPSLHMLDVVDRNSKRLLLLINNLLTISLVEAGTFALHSDEVAVDHLVERVRDAAAAAVASRELGLVVDMPPGLRMQGDQEQLERALLNLVTNAVKFTRPGGSIEIAVRASSQAIDISVRDTGCGIPAEEQAGLFTRFHRTAQAQEFEVQGTGLGLYITGQIVEMHGGTIAVQSSPTGSTFTIHLPRESATNTARRDLRPFALVRPADLS